MCDSSPKCSERGFPTSQHVDIVIIIILNNDNNNKGNHWLVQWYLQQTPADSSISECCIGNRVNKVYAYLCNQCHQQSLLYGLGLLQHLRVDQSTTWLVHEFAISELTLSEPVTPNDRVAYIISLTQLLHAALYAAVKSNTGRVSG